MPTHAPSGERLLVNYWYAPNVGHAIEGLRYALGYRAANPGMRVSLLLNGAAPAELAACCPWLDAVYPVPYTDFVRVERDPHDALAGVPREWDHVATNHRARQQAHDRFAGFRAFFDAAEAHLQPRRPPVFTGEQEREPAYAPHQDLRLALPPAAREAAGRRVGAGRPAIAVLPAGGGADAHLYPSVSSWELILGELARRHPDHVVCLIGKLRADGRTTSRIDRAAIDRLLASVPRAVDCFDLPILEQLAVVERSALLVSPHTGFSFCASAVGTPWLAISGGNWHEYLYNGVPVYSVLPDPARYGGFAWAELGRDPLRVLARDSDGDGPRAACMSAARIREDLPEILHAAELLIEGRLPYEQALADYFPRLLAAYGGDRSRVFSFDGIHERHLPAEPAEV